MSDQHDGDEDVCFDLDSLDRALQEVEALLMIYGRNYDDPGQDGDDGGPLSNARLVLKSTLEEMDPARSLVERSGNTASATTLTPPQSPQQQQGPTIALEMHLQVKGQDDDDYERSPNNDTTAKTKLLQVCLYFGLVPGYPSRRPVTVTVLTAQGLMSKNNKQAQEELGVFLQAKANELVGSEAILDLVQACQDRLTTTLLESNGRSNFNNEMPENKSPSEDSSNNNHNRNHSSALITKLSRRWIWVHHITDRQRKQDIVHEARHYKLGGYLKAGYPGIVVVEGPCHACDEFVMWIKGNKSRPGGFGRQWGHHVRGELIVTQRRLASEFCALQEEDMAVLAAASRQHNVQDEYKKFVMQHG